MTNFLRDLMAEGEIEEWTVCGHHAQFLQFGQEYQLKACWSVWITIPSMYEPSLINFKYNNPGTDVIGSDIKTFPNRWELIAKEELEYESTLESQECQQEDGSNPG